LHCDAADPAITLPRCASSSAPLSLARSVLDSRAISIAPAFIMSYIDWMALHKLNVLAGISPMTRAGDSR